MPRPCKRRRICAVPICDRFGPMTQSVMSENISRPKIVMSLDEFETIRLIDLEQVTQEECAASMNVARTTVQAIYNSARMKLAECLVLEKELCIEGGDYVVCEKASDGCGHRQCCRRNQECSEKGKEKDE